MFLAFRYVPFGLGEVLQKDVPVHDPSIAQRAIGLHRSKSLVAEGGYYQGDAPAGAAPLSPQQDPRQKPDVAGEEPQESRPEQQVVELHAPSDPSSADRRTVHYQHGGELSCDRAPSICEFAPHHWRSGKWGRRHRWRSGTRIRAGGSSEDQERSPEKHHQRRDRDDEPQVLQRHFWIGQN
jgi:hypothetical protein